MEARAQPWARAPVSRQARLLMVKRVALTTDAQSIYESSEVSTKSLRKRRLTAISVATINSIGISSFDDHKHQTTVRERPKPTHKEPNMGKEQFQTLSSPRSSRASTQSKEAAT